MPPLSSKESDGLFLDFADYVEMACGEEMATFESYPSTGDVERSGSRFLTPHNTPLDPVAVPYRYYSDVITRWGEYIAARREVFGHWYHLTDCPHCGTALDFSNERSESTQFHSISLRTCGRCGWWDMEEELPVKKDLVSNYYRSQSIHRRAILREFALGGSEAPIESLRNHISSHPGDLNQLSPRRLEELVGSIFAEFMNCEAIHVGGPGDGGIDLILVDGARRYVVQVKRRSSFSKSEGVQAIREFVGAMVLNGTLRGLFVTTAPRYSLKAIGIPQTALERGAVQYLELVDSRRLVDVLRLTTANTKPAWMQSGTRSGELLEHITPGFDAFMILAMGNPDWRLA